MISRIPMVFRAFFEKISAVGIPEDAHSGDGIIRLSKSTRGTG